VLETQPALRACKAGEEARQYTESPLKTKKNLRTLFQSIQIEVFIAAAALAVGN
jgi:hypothetical protein